MVPKLIAFDLDGTLVDSAPGIALSVDAMLESLGRPLAGLEKVRHYVGNGVERLVKRALTGDMDKEPPQDLYTTALERLLGFYAENNGYASLYPGVAETLCQLHAAGVRMCIITNKKRCFTGPLLEQMGISRFFECWVCGDDLDAKKPDPLPLQHAMRQLGVDAADAWMVGDSLTDVKTARAAGVKAVAVSYGYNHGNDIRTANPDCIVDSLLQICTILDLAA